MKVQVELKTKTNDIKKYNIDYVNDNCVFKYISKSIKKSIDEKRKPEEFIVGGWYNGKYYEEKKLKRKSFPKRISLNLKNIVKANFVKYCEKNNDWVVMRITYNYKNKKQTKNIRININDII